MYHAQHDIRLTIIHQIQLLDQSDRAGPAGQDSLLLGCHSCVDHGLGLLPAAGGQGTHSYILYVTNSHVLTILLGPNIRGIGCALREEALGQEIQVRGGACLRRFRISDIP